MSSPAKVLVLGSAGMLAHAFARILRNSPEFHLFAPPENECDISDRGRLDRTFREIAPELVLNCAAYTDVDGCERDPGRARLINAEAAGNIADACRGSGSLLVHVSTDFVFNGRSARLYRETDPADPLSVYGKTKLEGEILVAERAPRHLIVRTAWTFGLNRPNFVTKVLERAATQQFLEVVSDQVGSPTYTVDLAEGIMDLVKAKATGLFHAVNAGSCSRSDFARAILAAAGMTGVEVRDIKSIPTAGVAPRPIMSALDTGAFKKACGRTMRPWREALSSFLAEIGKLRQ